MWVYFYLPPSDTRDSGVIQLNVVDTCQVVTQVFTLSHDIRLNTDDDRNH